MDARVPHLLRRVWTKLRGQRMVSREELLSAAPQLEVVAYPYPPRYPGQEAIADREFYRPSEHGDWLFSPWKSQGEVRGHGEFHDYLLAALDAGTAIGPERLYTLFTLARQSLHLPDDFIETGVWRGGTAVMFAKLIREHSPHSRQLHLFDTFLGMPPTHEHDTYYKGGEFADTSLEAVQTKLTDAEFVRFHPGLIPDTFAGCEDLRFAFAHIDLDVYQSIRDACAFVFPRMVVGGTMVFDDYAWSTCPGARRAVDEYFSTRKTRPLVLSNGQAVVFKALAEE
ncbi:MAG: TylF/MycF family methyltransferase [Planctomycetia bacterium]|nr:TylF/MycF family methyltransferase [Planctomycetia bacterium]